MGRTINAIAIVALVLGLSACIEDRRPGGATGGHADQDSEADAGNDEPDAWADDDSGESIPPPCFVCYSVQVSSGTLRNVPVECSGDAVRYGNNWVCPCAKDGGPFAWFFICSETAECDIPLQAGETVIEPLPVCEYVSDAHLP